MRRRYENSPIVEAICDFQFAPNSFWDLTAPGLIYEKIKTSFPMRNQVAQISAAIAGNQGSITQQIATIPLMQFLREDGSSLVQIGQNLLTINQLKPYLSWEEFRSLIKIGLQSYQDVIPSKKLSRVTLRYINRIEFEKNKLELEDYLNFRPFLGKELPQEFNAFAIGVLLPYENLRDTLNIQLGSINTDLPNTTAMALDLNYILNKPEGFELDTIFEWIDTAHKNIEEIFEACITDQSRRLFKEVKK